MTDELTSAIQRFTELQRQAAEWVEGPFLLLAGPGSGKTQILSVRTALLLANTPKENFRVLALTFTTKAADEMTQRINNFVPGMEGRLFIGTYHSFCMDVLRQHGPHIDIKPDFAIYTPEECKALLSDSLKIASQIDQDLSVADVSYLKSIDELKKNLIGSADASPFVTPNDLAKTVKIYDLYEAALKENNALDFNGLILETYRLFTTYQAIAAQYQKAYKYWLVDEFQDTNPSQYKLISAMAGKSFKNIFVVADDDQIIFQWNGASYKQIENYRKDFEPTFLQLPTNFRCPPRIVDAANRLVGNNTLRSPEKKELESGKNNLKLPEEDHIRIWHFADESAEAEAIVNDIISKEIERLKIVVLARSRPQLEFMQKTFQAKSVPAVIAQRQDNFISSEYVWMDATLKQVARPLDQRNFGIFVESFNRLSGQAVPVDLTISGAEAASKSYINQWYETILLLGLSDQLLSFATSAYELSQDNSKYRDFIKTSCTAFAEMSEQNPEYFELQSDIEAWKAVTREVRNSSGAKPALSVFVQEVSMRSKEPPPDENAVTIMTIHGAKGKEYEYVYVVGLVEELLPSWFSTKADADPILMEEERRTCFVAITRAEECLTISWADRYRGYSKSPSRFLKEMGFNPDDFEV